MPGTLRSRGGAGGNECASERECERVRSLGGADRHVGGAGGARQPSRPLLGFRAYPPSSPTAPSPPRPAPAPAPGPYREEPLPLVLRLPLLLPSLPAARDRPLLPSPPHPAAHSDYHGECRGEPFGKPRNPWSPPRRRPRAGGVRAPLSFGSLDRTALRLLALPGLRKSSAHPKEVFCIGAAMMSGPWRCETG